MNFKGFTKKYWFAGLIFSIVLVNSFIFLPKYGALDGPSDIEYDKIAVNMANGDGFSLNGERTMFREPAYPFFLFLNYKLFGVNTNIIRAEQFIFLFLIIYLTYLITRELFGISTSRIASAMVSALPIFPIYATDIISEIFATFLAVLFVYLFIRSIKEQSKATPWIAGAVFGFLVLTKSIFIFLPVFILPIYFLGKRRCSLRNISLFLFAFLVVVSPWVYRNYINFGKISIANRGGMLLYLHSIKSEFNNKELKDYAVSAFLGEYFVRLYNPSFDIIKGEGIHKMNERRILLLKEGLDFADADKVMMSEARELYLERPFKNLFIGFLEVVKANAPMAPKYSIMFAFPGDIGDSFFEKIIKVAIILIIRIAWAAILLISIFGAFRALKEKNAGAILILLFIIYLNGIIFFLQGVPRFVFIIYPFYFIFFAFSASIIVNKFLWK